MFSERKLHFDSEDLLAVPFVVRAHHIKHLSRMHRWILGDRISQEDRERFFVHGVNSLRSSDRIWDEIQRSCKQSDNPNFDEYVALWKEFENRKLKRLR